MFIPTTHCMLNATNNLNGSDAGFINKESRLMIFFRRLGMDRIAWSLRRLYCPVKKSDLVLEVGSGGSPFYRANVLCDAYLETSERHNVPLVSDRNMVLAYVENLPFKDDSFDFIIACHVLEHSRDPEKFLSEIQRVGRAGYIEVPDAFFERLANYPVHYLEITDDNGVLKINKKPGPVTDKNLSFLFRKTKNIFSKWYSENPFNFHVRYYWSKNNGGIKYEIMNPEYSFDWHINESIYLPPPKSGLLIMVKQLVLKLFRKFFSQNKRNKLIKIENYLRCLKCFGDLNRVNGELKCNICFESYPILPNGIVNFTNTKQ